MRQSLLVVAVAVLLLSCGQETDRQSSTGEPIIEAAWIRLAPPGAHMLAGYMDIVNPESAAIEIVSASCSGFGSTGIHRTEMEDDVARMRPQDLVRVPAGATVSFAPGGLHLMLHDPQAKLEAGAMVSCTLDLKDGRQLSTLAELRSAVSRSAGNGGTR
jgi:copper(I)-binding protein